MIILIFVNQIIFLRMCYTNNAARIFCSTTRNCLVTNVLYIWLLLRWRLFFWWNCDSGEIEFRKMRKTSIAALFIFFFVCIIKTRANIQITAEICQKSYRKNYNRSTSFITLWFQLKIVNLLVWLNYIFLLWKNLILFERSWLLSYLC